jgi:6-phosphofructokinase 1
LQHIGNMKNIAVLTSGGDSPGMNACVRAVVRTARYHGCNTFGIMRGYQGMIEGDMRELQSKDVSNIIQRGGTILKTARSKEFRTLEGRAKAYENLKKHNIDGLVLIGGDGTCRGAVQFFKEYNIPAMATPGTIDNDLAGTDFTIGFDTAINTAVDAIDKIRDTADSHDRIFIIEVMGRDAGYIALHSGIACGAENILIPERTESMQEVVDRIADNTKRKKLMSIIVVAEGDQLGGATNVEKYLKEYFGNIDTRISILGHIQRGGSPSCADRILASRTGYAAVMGLLNGQSQQMVGVINNEVCYTPFEEVVKLKLPMKEDMVQMVKVLSA